MSTENLEWLIENFIHGDVSAEIPEHLRYGLLAKKEFEKLKTLEHRYNAMKDIAAEQSNTILRLQEEISDRKDVEESLTKWVYDLGVELDALKGKAQLEE